MRSMFGYGCRSPFLYGLACRLLKMHPDLFVKMGEFEIQVFLGGLKNGWLDQNLAVKAALSLSEVKAYRKDPGKTVSKFIQILSGNAGIRGIMRSSDPGKKDKIHSLWLV